MEPRAVLVFSSFHLDLANEQLWREGQLIALRPKTFAILQYLVEHPGRLVTKKELLHAVWGDTQVSEEGLRDYLREIRHALGDDATSPRFVETVRGRGYRFLPSVTTQPVASTKVQVPSFPPSPAPSPQHPAPTLVGRETELGQLHRWLDKALQGERQLVFVTGEPGIGKTTLVDAFLAQVAAQPSSLHFPAPSTCCVGWAGAVHRALWVRGSVSAALRRLRTLMSRGRR